MSNVANIIQNGIAPPCYLVDSNGHPISTAAGSDAVTASTILEVALGAYNGASVDQVRNNLDNFVLQASGAITTNGNSFDVVNYNARGVKVFITTGAFGSGASTITVSIQGKDPVSTNYYTALTSASLTASAFTVLTVYPGIAVTANVTASDVIPRTWRVAWAATAWGTSGSTLGISCALIL